MSTDNGCERKDMGDFKAGIVDTANTAKEIVQDKFDDAKTGTKNTVEMVDETVKDAARKVQNIAGDIKEGSFDVAKDIKKTAINVARTVTLSSKKDK